MREKLCLWIAIGIIATASVVSATQPCGDLDECKALVEINASDGDIGFHFLVDSDDLIGARILDPSGSLIFRDQARGALAEQRLTETFAESSEPLCWPDPEADPDEEIVTLEEFLDRWTPGLYTFQGGESEGEIGSGVSELSYSLPAAPTDVDFDGSVITWSAGDDLGRCATFSELTDLVTMGMLPAHPADVDVAVWEIVLEADSDPESKLVVRVPGDIAVKAVTVPADYLAALPADTPAKMEIGAITADDNATFSEEDGFCINEVDGCEEE